ncbi:uncharacterized protein LOC129775061 [Toxorhynchites rutilus septentrionalis]|uniref:uncharacterized protein LOC129775061 n=1 Tax=Toxorhynchites rutilus septentrionalis TaxID=329112 RepID=UPI00247AB766|nr:uncharacterized protein LOC129775061 [Toxorhynchites rutilus septentrionalis]
MDITSRIKILSILLALFIVPLVQVVQARRCYVCGEGGDAPFRTAMAAAAASSSVHHQRASLGSLPNIVTTCEDFERDREELDKYVLECPPSYTSCLTQVDGDMELRTCGESLSINDCKSANKIDYCYCSEDLCNGLKRTQIRQDIENSRRRAQSEHLRQHEPSTSDDEDLSESSGMEDSHEKHRSDSHRRAGLLGPTSHNSNVHNDKDVATTQLIITLKPIPTTERRNNNSTSPGTTSGTMSCWVSANGWSNLPMLLSVVASIWRLNTRWCHAISV